MCFRNGLEREERRAMKFDLAAQPFTVQLSGVPANSIRIAVTAD
jgi:hypothetical protein